VVTRFILFTLALTTTAIAQDSTIFRLPVQVVTAPTAVTSHEGKSVRGLQPHEFQLFDNDRSQNLRVDPIDEPVSLAIAVQTNDAVRAWLPQVRRIASAVEALLTGATGEASLIAFSDQITILQAPTSDTASLDHAFAALAPGGAQSRFLDAIAAASKQLSTAPPDHRRVILVIAQSGDAGSRATLRDILRDLEASNTAVYSLVMPHVGRDLIQNTVSVRGTNGQFGRADTGIMASVDLGKLIPEIFREGKGATGEDELSLLTAETGGRRIPFRRLKDLEAGVSAIGEEFHTEYLLSYTPDRADPGYHRIRVQLDRPGVIVRSRPGYYITQSSASPQPE
jgi:VWFA-related protein